MSISWTRLPFRFADHADYNRQLAAWLGRVFDEELPRAGYQVREQQIYFAFRVASALASGHHILAEAGSGTGKTFAYLLPAICHARLRGRPVVIATATATLQEQLAADDGDIATLSGLLGLDVDARVARRPEDVVCDIRVERFAASAKRVRGKAALLRWAAGSSSGVRSEQAGAPDALWREVAWNTSARCDVCSRRGYCRLMRGRSEMRQAADLIIISHDLFFEDVFGRQERLAPGQLPILPPFSAVIFDEGHRVAGAAQLAAGSAFRPGAVRGAIAGSRGQGARMRLLAVAEAAEHSLDALVSQVSRCVEAPEESGGDRRRLRPDAEMLEVADVLRRTLGLLQDEMTIEEGVQRTTRFAERLSTYHVRLDEATTALTEIGDLEHTVAWVETGALRVVPRDLGPLWRRKVPDRTPLVFSSATLSVDGSFAYSAAVLGLSQPKTAQVGVPFHLARQVCCYQPRRGVPDGGREAVLPALRRLLIATGGRALVLVPGPSDTAWLREHLSLAGTTLWEGQAASDHLLERFQDEVDSVLVGHSFWEGVDVPGEALSAVVVPWLPLPGNDPVEQARREDARAAGRDPLRAVDIPAMALRLKQGIGRLIRSETDRGVVAILDPRWMRSPYREGVEAVLPQGARRVATLRPVRTFLNGSQLRGRL